MNGSDLRDRVIGGLDCLLTPQPRQESRNEHQAGSENISASCHNGFDRSQAFRAIDRGDGSLEQPQRDTEQAECNP